MTKWIILQFVKQGTQFDKKPTLLCFFFVFLLIPPKMFQDFKVTHVSFQNMIFLYFIRYVPASVDKIPA